MLKKIISTTLLLFAFSGCSTKETIIYPPCIIITEVEQPKTRQIRVYKEDENLTKAYLKEFRGKIDALNNKIKKANETCLEWRNK